MRMADIQAMFLPAFGVSLKALIICRDILCHALSCQSKTTRYSRIKRAGEHPEWTAIFEPNLPDSQRG